MHELMSFILGELRGTWRFRWYALAVAFLVAGAGAYVVLTMPDEYRAQARVQVDTESMLRPLLGNLAVSPDLNTRVQVLTNTLLSRENVERIANEADLMVRARTPVEEQRLLEGLSGNINIDGGRNNIYRISYASNAPDTAHRVVQSTLDILTEKTMGMTQSDSATAIEFLERQVGTYEERLRRAEQRLAEFKRENMGMLPEQGGRDYYGRLRAAEDNLEELESALRTAQNRRDSLGQEIRNIEAGEQTETIAHPRLILLDEQLQRSRERLDELLLRFTESHPDVVALRGQIERQQEERDRMAEQPGVTAGQDFSANPIYQELQIRLNEWNAEIAALQTQIADQKQRIESLRNQVDEITDVETRLADLNRNYEVTRGRYQALLERLSTAEMSTEVDASGGQMQFRLIDPPSKPLEPSGPPRQAYLLFLIPVGFGIGGGFAFFLHQIRPVFHNKRLLSDWTGRPVLGSVSLVMTRNQRRLRFVAVTVFGFAALVLVAIVGAGALYADLAADQLQTLMRRLPL